MKEMRTIKTIARNGTPEFGHEWNETIREQFYVNNQERAAASMVASQNLT